jgi:hypothetical protein
MTLKTAIRLIKKFGVESLRVADSNSKKNKKEKEKKNSERN